MTESEGVPAGVGKQIVAEDAPSTPGIPQISVEECAHQRNSLRPVCAQQLWPGAGRAGGREGGEGRGTLRQRTPVYPALLWD